MSLTNALRFFERVFDQGTQILGTDALSLLEILISIEVVFAGIYLALGASADFRAMAKKIILIGFFFYVITNYQTLLNTVVEGFLHSGLRGGASTNISFSTLQDPDRIFQTGLNILKPVVDKVYADASNSYFNIPTTDGWVLLICVVISLLSFGLMAIQVFITYLEYLLITAAGLILLPFGVFKPTAFIAERVFGAIIAFGIKLMVLALIVGVSEQYVQTIIIPETASWREGFEFVIISLALAFLTIQAPSIALSLLSGAPQLSFQSAAATAAGTALASGYAASKLGQAARTGKSSASTAASKIGRAGASMIGAAAAGASLARSNSSASGNGASGSGSGGSNSGSNQNSRFSRNNNGANNSNEKPFARTRVGGALKGVGSAMASNAKEKIPFTQKNKRASMIAQGLNPDEKSLKASFQGGKNAVPAYRRQKLGNNKG